MSADMHIHIFEGIEEKDLKIFFSNTIGSKYCLPIGVKVSDEAWEKAYEKIANTPNIWIGEVSWLKAGLTSNPEKYVPAPIQKISDIIGEDLPKIDDELIQKVENALRLKNTTSYQVANPKDVVKFLKKHKGKKVFTVSW